jgi:large subunit ribosomal protein L19
MEAMNPIDEIEKEQARQDVPEFSVGDTVEVDVKITEGERQRVHAFTGIVISRRGSGMGETFTVRRIVAGEGVERTFPVNSPAIADIKVLRQGDVRRAKLHYLRKRAGKAARIKDRVPTRPDAGR